MPKLIECRFCGRTLAGINHLRNHISYAHPYEEPLQCHECKKTFWTDVMMNNHMKTHLTNTLEATFKEDSDSKCRFCGSSYVTIELLVEHMELIHGNEELIKCAFYDKCDKIFRLNEVLDMYEHMDKDHSEHKSEKQMTIPKPMGKSLDKTTCYRCGKKLTSTDSLARHMRYHDNIKPYICRFCQKSFVEAAHLYRHIKLCHIHAEPIACPFYPDCSKTFWLNEMLARHIERSHKDKDKKSRPCKEKITGSHADNHSKNKDPIKCPFYYKCGEMFLLNEMLAKHIRISHKDHEVSLKAVITKDKEVEEAPIEDACSEEIFDLTYNGESVRLKMKTRHVESKVQKSRPDHRNQSEDMIRNEAPFSYKDKLEEMSGPEDASFGDGKCNDLDITPKPYESAIKCPFYESCGKLCQSNQLMQRHVKQVHELHTVCELGNLFTKAVNEGLICYHCLKVFTNKITLETHISRSHDAFVNEIYRNAAKQGKVDTETRDAVCVSDVDEDDSLSHVENKDTSNIQHVTSPKASDQVIDSLENQLVIFDSGPVESEETGLVIGLGTKNSDIVCGNDDEGLYYMQDRDPAIGERVTIPMATKQISNLDSSENQDAISGHVLFENGDPEFMLTSESVVGASVISILPLDNEHELQVVEIDCDSLDEDTDPVIHNIVPIHDDPNSCKDKGTEWPYINEGAIKTEDNELLPFNGSFE